MEMIDQLWTSNILFLGLSDEQLKLVEPHISEKKYPPHEVIMEEGDSGSFLFLIDEGTVTVNKDELVLTTRVAGDLVGLMSLIDLGPRSATVVAGPKGVKGFVMSKAGLEGIMDSEKDSIVSTMLLNYIKYQQNAIRNTNSLSLHEARSRQELEKKREKSAKLYVQMVIGLIAFAALIGIVDQKWFALENTFFKFVPFVVFGAWTYYYVNLSRIPFKDIGLTLSNFRPAFFSMIKATTVFLLFMVGIKWICITALPEYFGYHMLEIDQFNSMDKSQTIWLILFIVFQPFIEELLTRGCLQNGMFQFLIGEQTKKTGILAAALLFSLAYLFFDLKIALISLISGLFLGSLFYKWKSIPAVYMMHILISVAAILLFQIIS